MQAGRQTSSPPNRCHERARKGCGPNEIREMFFAEFSTLSEPTLRSAPVPSFPQLVCLRFILRARGAYALSLVTEAGVPHPRSDLEVCISTGNRCGEFQIERPPDKKSGSMVVALHTQNFVRQIFGERRVSSSAACRLCLHAGFT